jgi:hypothetical protein
MWTAVKSSKCCATCANWRGARKDKGNAVETGGPSDRGKCGAGVFSSVTQGQCASEGHNCSKYVKL